MKSDQKSKLEATDNELLVAKTELDCLKRELNEKNVIMNSERAKLEDLIRTQEVSLRSKLMSKISIFL